MMLCLVQLRFGIARGSIVVSLGSVVSTHVLRTSQAELVVFFRVDGGGGVMHVHQLIM